MPAHEITHRKGTVIWQKVNYEFGLTAGTCETTENYVYVCVCVLYAAISS